MKLLSKKQSDKVKEIAGNSTWYRQKMFNEFTKEIDAITEKEPECRNCEPVEPEFIKGDVIYGIGSKEYAVILDIRDCDCHEVYILDSKIKKVWGHCIRLATPEEIQNLKEDGLLLKYPGCDGKKV